MDLYEQLRDLEGAADAAVDGVSAPPAGDLWERGTRWQRRRRTGSVVALAPGAVVVGALTLVGLDRVAPPEPAPSPSGVTLPARAYEPSPWLPVALPREQVVAAQLTERGTWSGSVPSIAVITGSGRYVYLDVPRIADQGSVAVSPDGRRIAYWLAGTPMDVPYTSDGQTIPITGVAVVDVVSGQVERRDFATDHGLSPAALTWADDDTLLGNHAQWAEGDGATQQGTSFDDSPWRWDVASTTVPTSVDLPPLDDFVEAAGTLVLDGDRLYDLSGGDARRLPLAGQTGSMGSVGSNAFLRTDGLLARLGGPGTEDAVPNVVSLADLTAAQVVETEVPGSAGTYQVLGWRADELVIARASSAVDPSGLQAGQIATVDIATGESQVLVDGPVSMLQWGWATDLLDAPVVEGIEPPAPMDPRVVAGVGGGLLVCIVGALVVWRRRARP